MTTILRTGENMEHPEPRALSVGADRDENTI